MSPLTKTILMRFVRGTLSGAISAMAIINLTAVNTFKDLHVFLGALLISFVVGGIAGLIQSVDKYLRSFNEE